MAASSSLPSPPRFIKPLFCQLRGSFFALAQVDGIIFGRFLEDLGAVGALFRQGRHIKKPAQVIRRRGTVFYKLGNQHPGYVVIELVTHAVVFIGAIGHGKLCIVGQALGNIAPMQQPIIGNRVGDALLYRVHGSIRQQRAIKSSKKAYGLMLEQLISQ